MLLAAAGSAHVRYIVADGRWAGLERTSHGPELAYFDVVHRVAKKLHYVVYLECHNVDSGQDYARTFDAGGGFAPQRIPADGELNENFMERTATYTGRVDVILSWRGRVPSAEILIDQHHTSQIREDCSTYAFIRLHHSRVPVAR